MAIITVIIEDTEQGDASVKFVSNTPLPEDTTQYTPAQVFAQELYNQLDKIHEGTE